MMFDRIIVLPPLSPELNPIEKVWAIIKRWTEKKKPKTVDDLKKAVKESWKGITPQFVCKANK